MSEDCSLGCETAKLNAEWTAFIAHQWGLLIPPHWEQLSVECLAPDWRGQPTLLTECVRLQFPDQLIVSRHQLWIKSLLV